MLDTTLASLLKGAELFQTLLDDDLAYIASVSSVKRLAANAELFAPGSRAERFYIVAEGELSVRRINGRKTEELARFCAGEVLGDFDFAIGRKHSDGAYAATDCLLVEFPAEGRTLSSIASEKPDTASRLIFKSLVMVSSRIRSAHALIKENAPWVRELRLQVHTDPATGLWSRAFLDEALPGLIVKPTAFVSLKPDKFKDLVDTFGHSAGDSAMERIAARLKKAVSGKSGWALRLTSNQTALVLPATGAAEAREIASMAAMPIKVKEAGDTVLSFSGALGIWPDDCADFKELAERCDKVMMRIWKEGGGAIARVPGTGMRVGGGG